MRLLQDNLPPFVEEQISQQKIKIPTNFVELQILQKNNWGSTEGLDKPLCERYTFKYDNKLVTLDITQELREKLGLEPNLNCFYPIYINKELLEKEPEWGGITVGKEKDILCQNKGVILLKNEGVQVDFTSGKITELAKQLKESKDLNEETLKVLEKVFKDKDEKQIVIIFLEGQLKESTKRITELYSDLEKEILNKRKLEINYRELERVIAKLKEDEQVLLSLQYRINDLQTELGNERLVREGVEQDLQTTQQERDRLKTQVNNLTTQCYARPDITQAQYDALVQEREVFSLRPTQLQLTQAVNSEKAKWVGYVNSTTYRNDWISPLDLEEMVTKTDYDKVVSERNARPNTTLTDQKNLLDCLNYYRKGWLTLNVADFDTFKDKVYPQHIKKKNLIIDEDPINQNQPINIDLTSVADCDNAFHDVILSVSNRGRHGMIENQRPKAKIIMWKYSPLFPWIWDSPNGSHHGWKDGKLSTFVPMMPSTQGYGHGLQKIVKRWEFNNNGNFVRWETIQNSPLGQKECKKIQVLS